MTLPETFSFDTRNLTETRPAPALCSWCNEPAVRSSGGTYQNAYDQTVTWTDHACREHAGYLQEPVTEYLQTRRGVLALLDCGAPGWMWSTGFAQGYGATRAWAIADGYVALVRSSIEMGK